MTLQAEQAGGFVVNEEKPLCLTSRSEPAPDRLSFPGGPVRALGAIAQPLVRPVVHIQTGRPQGCAVAAQPEDTGLLCAVSDRLTS